ncbi:MAG: putative LPS assembly protein LptD [Paludibacteraceae bacterium]|nr:putative LPS assembly protein LptD [Paludibacteraceae bacterium]
MKFKSLYLIIILWIGTFISTYAVEQEVPDSVYAETVPTTSVNTKKKNAIDAPIHYKANDSIIFYGSGNGFLYGEGNVRYEQARPIELKAGLIQMKMDSNTVFATGRLDSLGKLVELPVFKDNTDEYSSKELAYNFETRKGFIRGGITQQGEGYIVADKTKKMNEDEMCMQGGKYTTCDHHDHPHFYLQLTKAKVKPGSYIAAGPAYLVMEDVPLPLVIPFGFFPFTSSYSSGIIMPSYGDEMERGLFLKNGGYYFAINDYLDLEVTGEIYTKGTWGLQLGSTYTKRYKFNGNFRASYREDVYGEKDLPGYSKYNNFKVAWTHRQDPKASQYSSLSASVDFTTSGYNQSNVNNYYNPAEQSKNITSSSVNYTQRFPESPWSLSVNALVSQRSQDSTISLSLPNITVAMSRIYPFKRKEAVGKERFYEKIALSYNMTFANSITAKENKLMTSSFTKDWKNAIDHKIPITASFNLFKYLTISPSINLHDRMYFNKVNRSWNKQQQEEQLDTMSGFFNVYDFNVGVSMQTKLYGFYTPNRKLFGDKIDRIRHVMTPSVSFNYHPDFGDDVWDFYSSYEKIIVDKNDINKITHQTVTYSPYSNGMYGVPGQGMVGAISWSLGNNVEMKVKDQKKSDEVGSTQYKKVSLIDNFTVSGGYNFAADSMKLQNFNAQLRIKLTKSFSLNLNGAFDPYKFGLNEYGKPVRVNQLRDFPRFQGTGTSFQYTFNNDTFKKKDKTKPTNDENQDEENSGVDFNLDQPSNIDKEKAEANSEKTTNSDGYVKPAVTWSFTFNYSVRWGISNQFDYDMMDYKREWNHNLSFSGNLNPTPKWKLNYTGSFDLTALEITQMTLSIVRDLHCWRLSASVSPFGRYKSYMVTVGVNASMLQDLKYEKRSDNSRNVLWF